MRRLTWGLAPVGPAIVALGILTLIAAHRHPGESFGGGSGPALFLQLLAGLGTASGGAYLVWQRSALAGALLLATAAAVFLQQLPLPESGSSLLFTAALAGGAMTSTLAGVAALVVSGHRVADVLVSGPLPAPRCSSGCCLPRRSIRGGLDALRVPVTSCSSTRTLAYTTRSSASA